MPRPDGLPARPQVAVGVGCRPGTTGEAIVAAVREVLGPQEIRCLATLDRRAAEPGLLHAAEQLGAYIVGFAAQDLERVPVPNPSPRTASAVGTSSVAEAAALLAAAGTELLVSKQVIGGVAVAVAAVW